MGRQVMKTIGVWNRYASLNSKLFLTPNAPIGDDLLLPFNELYLEGRSRDVKFITLDRVSDLSTLNGILFIDMPEDDAILRKAIDSKVPLYLLTFEPPVVCPDNWRRDVHQMFTKIFTWDDVLVRNDFRDPAFYIEINFAQRFPKMIPHDGPTRKKLACMIASNKSSGHPFELYSDRRSVIYWFEENAPQDLHLYGQGWSELHRGVIPRGVIPPGQKREVLADYKFSICYENARSLPGYITEKIFDCFIAGTIPIYLGAPNIDHYVPDDCYIDRREFIGYQDLYRYTTTMSETEHETRIAAIQAFLQSESARPFTIERFVETILGNIA